MFCEEIPETYTVCHAFLDDARFYLLLTYIDQDIAAEVRAGGCSCGGVLHSACYPRKPRGVPRSLLGDDYTSRLSFCCAEDGCRRRCTPPSVRFLGRKAYLGTIVILLSALEHGLSPRRRQRLIDTLDISLQTLARWKRWWRKTVPATRVWQALRGQFMPPLDGPLPDVLLGRLIGADLPQRLCRVLVLLMPLTTTSCSRYPRGIIDPQTM